MDKYIRFLFITGITKVSHVNIFSGLNQLDDISLTKDYAPICGVTESELEKYFAPEIELLAKEQEMTVTEAKAKLAKMYDGYHFTHNVEGVYNPFCLLKCLKYKDFGSYWFESGYLTIKDFQKEKRLYTLDFPNREIEEGFLNVILKNS